MHGIGRKVLINSLGYGKIWEGQFIKGKLNGFGRFMALNAYEQFIDYLGRWKESTYHGYGRRKRSKEFMTGFDIK